MSENNYKVINSSNYENGKKSEDKVLKALSKYDAARPDRSDVLVRTKKDKRIYIEVKNLNSTSKEQRFQINNHNLKNTFVDFYIFTLDHEIIKVLTKDEISQFIKNKDAKRIKIPLNKIIGYAGISFRAFKEFLEEN